MRLMSQLGVFCSLQADGVYNFVEIRIASGTCVDAKRDRNRSLLHYEIPPIEMVVTRMDTPKSDRHLHSKYMIGVL